MLPKTCFASSSTPQHEYSPCVPSKHISATAMAMCIAPSIRNITNHYRSALGAVALDPNTEALPLPQHILRIPIEQSTRVWLLPVCVPPRMFSHSCRPARKLIEKMHALDEGARGAKSTYSKRISRCSVFSQITLPDPRMSHGSSILAKCEVLGRPKSATKPTNEMSLTLTTALGFLVLNACSLGRHAALGDLRSN